MDAHPSFVPSKFRWVFWAFVAIAGFFLFTEHHAHVLGILSYLLLAICPLMHLFMHHGHHHGSPKDEPGEHEHHHDEERQS